LSLANAACGVKFAADPRSPSKPLKTLGCSCCLGSKRLLVAAPSGYRGRENLQLVEHLRARNDDFRAKPELLYSIWHISGSPLLGVASTWPRWLRDTPILVLL